MGVKISDLPASAGAALAMQFEVNNAGTSERLTLAQMFALSTGAVVADTPLLNMAQTWNNAGVTFTGWKLNVTDSASDAASLLAAFQIGGTTKFQVSKNGELRSAGGLYVNQSGGSMTGNRSVVVFDSGDGGRLQLSGYIGFGPFNDDAGAAADVFIRRDAANTLAQRNGTNEQQLRVYGTFTDASNNAYLQLIHFPAVGFCGVFSKNNGTGVLQPLRFGIGALAVFQIATDGHLNWVADNTYDIGASGANRPRDIHAGQNITAGNLYKIGWSGVGGIVGVSDGVFRLQNNAANGFDRLQFGGTSNAFPALKRNSAAIEARLADDSAYATLRGKITTEAAAVSETITPNKTLTLYDVNGTAYKVPCVAA